MAHDTIYKFLKRFDKDAPDWNGEGHNSGDVVDLWQWPASMRKTLVDAGFLEKATPGALLDFNQANLPPVETSAPAEEMAEPPLTPAEIAAFRRWQTGTTPAEPTNPTDEAGSSKADRPASSKSKS